MRYNTNVRVMALADADTSYSLSVPKLPYLITSYDSLNGALRYVLP